MSFHKFTVLACFLLELLGWYKMNYWTTQHALGLYHTLLLDTFNRASKLILTLPLLVPPVQSSTLLCNFKLVNSASPITSVRLAHHELNSPLLTSSLHLSALLLFPLTFCCSPTSRIRFIIISFRLVLVGFICFPNSGRLSLVTDYS